MVIKVNEIALRETLDLPRAIHVGLPPGKFAAEQASTRVLSIDCDVGRTGALTPVATLEPVSLSGTIVSRASLHNLDFIRERMFGLATQYSSKKPGKSSLKS